MKQATQNIRTIDHVDHTDIERLFYVYSPDGKGECETKAIWAVVWCGQLPNRRLAMTNATYKFDYAIQRLKDAIDYAQTDGDFQQARLWSLHVEAAYNADIASADEGLKLFHSIASNGEQSVLSRLDGGADVQDAVKWQDAPEYKEAQKVSDNFNFDTVTEQEF